MEDWTYEVLDQFWKHVHKWRRRTRHDKALIIVTMIAVFEVCFSVCMLDSYNWLWAFVTAIIGCAWILLFLYANSRDKRKTSGEWWEF